MAEATQGQTSNKSLELLWDEIKCLVILTNLGKGQFWRGKQGIWCHMKIILKHEALALKPELDIVNQPQSHHLSSSTGGNIS